MKRPGSQSVIGFYPFELAGGAKRQRLELACGHLIERAPRGVTRPLRAYCPVCIER